MTTSLPGRTESNRPEDVKFFTRDGHVGRVSYAFWTSRGITSPTVYIRPDARDLAGPDDVLCDNGTCELKLNHVSGCARGVSINFNSLDAETEVKR